MKFDPDVDLDASLATLGGQERTAGESIMRGPMTSWQRLALAGLLLLTGLTAGCEASSDGTDTLADTTGTDAIADTPAEVPPADVPPDDLPPQDTPHEMIDETCPAPTPYPGQCEAVSDFQCGFMATCVAGVIQADLAHPPLLQRERSARGHHRVLVRGLLRPGLPGG